MNRSRLFFFVLSAAFVFPLLSGTLLGAPAGDDESEDSFYKYLSIFTEVLRLVRHVYVEEADVDQLMAGALDGASDALDPFSTYIPEEKVDSYLEAQDIGRSHSGLVVLKERGVVYVVAVQEGSPAAKADIQRGDIISRLHGRVSRIMPLWEMQSILAGAPGGRLSLELVRRGTTVEVEFDLTEFEPPGVRVEEVRGVPVLRIPEFAPHTPRQVAEAMDGFGQEKLLIDLRGVVGGDPEVAYAIAQRFATGELGVLLGRSGPLKRFDGSREEVWRGSVAVLVDRGSQGAAEILAKVLRQRANAKLVGERTFGYAGRPQLLKLSSGAYLQITDAFYTGPDKEPLNESVSPDVSVDGRVFVEGRWRSVDPSDEPPRDPILERALDLLLEEDEVPVEKVA